MSTDLKVTVVAGETAAKDVKIGPLSGDGAIDVFVTWPAIRSITLSNVTLTPTSGAPLVITFPSVDTVNGNTSVSAVAAVPPGSVHVVPRLLGRHGRGERPSNHFRGHHDIRLVGHFRGERGNNTGHIQSHPDHVRRGEGDSREGREHDHYCCADRLETIQLVYLPVVPERGDARGSDRRHGDNQRPGPSGGQLPSRRRGGLPGRPPARTRCFSRSQGSDLAGGSCRCSTAGVIVSPSSASPCRRWP